MTTPAPDAVDNFDEALILDAVDRFLEREVRPVAHDLEASDTWPEQIVAAMKELGLFGATISPEYGGLGLPATTYSRIVERVSAVWMSVSGIFNSHLIMAAAVERFGSEEMKRHYLPRFASGELRGGIALTEPDAGTDLQGIRTRAIRDGEDYVINGAKTWISNSVMGGILAVLVKTDPHAEPAHRGMSLLLVEKGVPGFRITKKLEKLGYKGIDSGEMVFEDARAPSACLIGEEGKGLQHILAGLELGRINVAARGVGVARACLEDSVRYAQLRKTFGKPICEHQAIALKLADMATRVEAARLLVNSAAARLRHRRALRHGGRHGQAVRHRGGGGELAGGHAHPRRLRLLQGVQHRALLPRCATARHRRGHQRAATPHHHPPAREAVSGVRWRGPGAGSASGSP